MHEMQRLIKVGDLHALVIEKSLLDALHIGEETLLEISAEGHRLVITPCRDQVRQKKVAAILHMLHLQYGTDLKRITN